MRFTRLKLTGFKSFVEPSELLIAPGLTGVVGPNGCGKSNLLEAIRWVMGEGSARTLRGGAMDDVIFAGTDKRPRRDFAEVALHAENVTAQVGGVGDLDAEEVEVVRRIERGAGSAYRINGRDVRAKDVTLLFADAATGAHSPALVSQGRIAAVIAARPTDRRAMLEEAAGIAGLHVRRRDAEQKLRATEANLARLSEVMGDMENRAAALKRQARAAEKYRELGERIALAEARALFGRYRAAVAEEEQATAAAQATEAAVRAAQEAQLAAAAAARAALDALNARREEGHEAREAANEARNLLDKLAAQRRAADRRLVELRTQIQRLVSDEVREKALDEDAAAAGQRLAAEAEAIAARIAALESDLPDLARRIAVAENASRDTEVALAQAMARQAAEQAERRVAEAALIAARQRLERAEAEKRAIENAIAALPDPGPVAERLAAAETLRVEAIGKAEAAEAAMAAAELARAQQVELQSARQGALAADKATLAALDAEAAALRKATLRPPGSNRAIDRVRPAPGYEHALAAALGDALNAPIAATGPMAWTGAAAQKTDPRVPKDCVALAAHVEAPPELARALALVLVADADDGRALAAGQSLVTRDGRVRRWDGLVMTDGGAANAEHLVRLNRLDAIVAERPAHVATVGRRTLELADGEATLRGILAEQQAARLAAGEARQSVRAAEKVIDEQSALAERLAQRRADLDRRAEEQAAELDASCAAHETAIVAVRDLPDGRAAQEDIIRLNQACETARRHAADLRAEQAQGERALAEQRQRGGAVEGERRSWRERGAAAAARLADIANRRAGLSLDITAAEERPAELDARIAEAEADAAARAAASTAAVTAETAAAAAQRAAEDALAAANEGLSASRERRASSAARADHAVARRMELSAQCGERFQCPAPVLPERFGFTTADIRDAEREQAALDRLLAERERMGPVNLVAAQELAEMEEELARNTAERDELTLAVNRLRGSVGSLNREGRQRLLKAFEAVNGHFQRLFTALFNGGQAHLALVDSDDPLEAGLEIFAQPPGKKLATLTLLSGGEQALTAVALIFGLFLTNPAPICVLDEVDAPLDDANVERFCDLLDRMATETETRYLIVTHNAVTMSRMHRLFGVTMVEQGVSRLVSVDLSGAEQLLQEAG